MAEQSFLSHRIAAELREAIISGTLPPETILPSERELIEKYQTTKSTASKAIALLVAEGLVTTQLGRGTFVRRTPLLATMIGIREDVRWLKRAVQLLLDDRGLHVEPDPEDSEG